MESRQSNNTGQCAFQKKNSLKLRKNSRLGFGMSFCCPVDCLYSYRVSLQVEFLTESRSIIKWGQLRASTAGVTYQQETGSIRHDGALQTEGIKKHWQHSFIFMLRGSRLYQIMRTQVCCTAGTYIPFLLHHIYS